MILKNYESSKKLKFNKLPKKGLIVAEGEQSGHCHTIVAEKQDVEYSILEDGSFVIKTGESPSKITHQEHKTIELEPQTIYFIGHQHEYDPSVEFKRVID